MDPLRTLLIDCRIELRKLVRDFHKTELCERLDAMAQTLQRTPVELVPDAPPSPAAQHELREASSQVALAWQAAARDLKYSHPPLYEQMTRRVMQRLEAKTLQDPAEEILTLEQEAQRARDQLAVAEKAAQLVEVERNALLGALATAVPELADGGDRVGVALARIEWLQARLHEARESATVRVPIEEEGRIPSAETLAQVAVGARPFTAAQREWCVGEAMVLSGFQYTPMELIEQGDARIAGIIAENARTG